MYSPNPNPSQAAYDVATEAVEDGKRREAALLKRAEAAERR